MRYYIKNSSGEKFFFSRLEKGQVPTSERGVSLGSIAEINDSGTIFVVITGYQKSYQVFPA